MKDHMIEPGHQHESPHGRVIVLSHDWLAERTSAQIQGYVATVAALTHEDINDVDEMAARFKDGLARYGIELADVSYTRAAAQIIDAAQVQIMTDTGEILYSEPGISTEPPSHRATGVEGTEDPEHPARPTLGT